MQETQVQALGQEDSLEEGMETHSSILGPSQVALVLKNPSASARDEGLIPVLGTHSSILACRIPMDRGAWQVTVHRVTKHQTQLSKHSTECSVPQEAVMVYT